jgi:hypothetical protein
MQGKVCTTVHNNLLYTGEHASWNVDTDAFNSPGTTGSTDKPIVNVGDSYYDDCKTATK